MIDQKAQDYFYKNIWQSNIHLFKHSGDNLINEINKLKPKDWDRITEFSMKNPNLTMHQILLEYTKNR